MKMKKKYKHMSLEQFMAKVLSKEIWEDEKRKWKIAFKQIADECGTPK